MILEPIKTDDYLIQDLDIALTSTFQAITPSTTIIKQTNYSAKMDEIATNLELLHILADPNLELSAQVLQPALATFALLPKLPRELRDRVWFHSLPGRRIIHLNPTPLGESDSFKPPPLPKALHICQGT